MLNYLYIDNIAVIENARIELDAGFTVLTGETGSGKSIVIDAIYAVLGEKTSKELIRSGSDAAVVSACFSNLSNKVVEIIENSGFILEDGKLIIQRKLSKEGKNTVRINGMPATVSVLKEIGSYLVNIHGQHDSQKLLNATNHLSFLDGFIGENKAYDDYKKAFTNLKEIANKLRSIDIDEDEKTRKLDLLDYQINEILSANIKPNEIYELKNEINLLKNSEKIAQNVTNAKKMLKGFDDADLGVLGRIAELNKNNEKISKIASLDDEILKLLSNAENELYAVYAEYEKLENSIKFDENEFKEKQLRLDLLNSIVVKYGGTEEKTLEFLEKALEEQKLIKFNENARIELEEKLEIAENELINKGEILTKLRLKYAKILEEKILKELEFLDFNNVKFEISINKDRYTKTGCDFVEFLISANAGESPKPLIKVASGGELSRIMLALRSVLSLQEDAETLIFDEIDTGISGFAAGKISKKLRDISSKFQTICVTHLAQIASKADNHLLINKQVLNDKTYTNVTQISGEERIKEIARIISGEEITESVYNSAKEMLGV